LSTARGDGDLLTQGDLVPRSRWRCSAIGRRRRRRAFV